MKENIEEDIKYIEEQIEYLKEIFASTKRTTLEVKILKDDIDIISNILSDYKRVLKENEELKADSKRLTDEYMIQKHLINAKFLSDYIPKQKIKDKIEELEEKRIKMEKEDIGVGFTLGEEWSDLKSKIKAYKDLLEEKGE